MPSTFAPSRPGHLTSWRVACALTATIGAAGCASDASEPVVFERTPVFVAGEDGYPRYRIPSLIETSTGALLAIAEGRHSNLDDTGDIDLVMRRSIDAGRTWSTLSVIHDEGTDTAGNPAPVVDRASGEILLPFCTNPAAAMNDRRVYLTRSTDDGQSWSTPVELTSQVKAAGVSWFATGPGRSIQMRSGRFVVPCNGEYEATSVRFSCVMVSDDGTNWQVSEALAPELDESQVAELDDGTLLLSMRDESSRGLRAFARSHDGGLTFDDVVYDEAIRDPHCQGSLLATRHGLFFSNPASDEWGGRSHLTVRWSRDGGATWPTAKLLDVGPSAYSSLAITEDGQLHCLYEAGEFLPYDRIDVLHFTRAYLEMPDP